MVAEVSDTKIVFCKVSPSLEKLLPVCCEYLVSDSVWMLDISDPSLLSVSDI